MTARTAPRSPTARQSLFTAVFQSAQALLAALPVDPLDVGIAHLMAGYAFLSDPKVIDRASARQTLVDLLARFDADAGTPAETSH